VVGLKLRWGVRQTAGSTARAAKGGRERYAASGGRRSFKRASQLQAAVASLSSTQVGAWSLALSQPRTSRYTPAPTRRPAMEGLRSK
jgi:hypothetical protein